jgi:quinol monooxygenase YgiN
MNSNDNEQKHMNANRVTTSIIFGIIMLAVGSAQALAQQENRKIRIAKIEVYPACLEEYKAALAEHAKVAVRAEPGVLALQAVYDKALPTQIVVFEVYASDSAYQAHLKTPHFLKYKSGTLKMVKSLELIEVAPIAMEIKPELIQIKE